MGHDHFPVHHSMMTQLWSKTFKGFAFNSDDLDSILYPEIG